MEFKLQLSDGNVVHEIATLNAVRLYDLVYWRELRDRIVAVVEGGGQCFEGDGEMTL